MSSSSTSNKRIRDIQRFVPLAMGVFLIAYIYTPLGDSGDFESLIRLIIIPVLVVTGILMWQLPRIRKRLRDRIKSGTARERSEG